MEQSVHTGLASSVRFPLLSTERYLNAQQAAKDAVKKRIRKPEERDFKTATVSHYPNWFIYGVIGALIVVMIASFWVSAGKQVAASGLMFDHLPGEFSHLTDTWSNGSIISMLILSEIGSILFLVSSGTIALSAPKATVRRWVDEQGNEHEWAVNITQWVLRLFAFVCAGYAILSNITITVLDPLDSVTSWLQWTVSIFMPVTVLGLGILLERIVIEQLRSSADCQRRYQVAMINYQAALEAPQNHEYYPSLLMDALFDEIRRYKRERDAMGEVWELVQSSEQHRVWLVQAEYAAHQQSNSLIMDGANPFLALPATTEQSN